MHVTEWAELPGPPKKPLAFIGKELSCRLSREGDSAPAAGGDEKGLEATTGALPKR